MLFGKKKKGPKKYSQAWFRSISDEEFYAEREPVRIAAVYKGDKAAEIRLDRFNDEEIRRLNEKYEKEHPDAKPRHREHGWYLPNDD